MSPYIDLKKWTSNHRVTSCAVKEDTGSSGTQGFSKNIRRLFDICPMIRQMPVVVFNWNGTFYRQMVRVSFAKLVSLQSTVKLFRFPIVQ